MTDSGPALRRRILTAVLIALAAVASVAVTARDPGLTWDESIYFGRAIGYLKWFAAPEHSLQDLFLTWFTPPDHPPLGCLWIAFSFRTFGAFFDAITAARLGAALLFGLVVATIFLWTAGRRDDRTGVLAAAAFGLMPRIFAHAHFANLEMITVLLWLLVTVAFERGIANRRWSVFCGLLFGLALLTKINAVFLPLILVPWGLLFHGRKALWNAGAMLLLGPAVFVLGWPVLWHFPYDGLYYYLANKGIHLPWRPALDLRVTARGVTPVYYLGTVFSKPFAPWHYPFVMLLATTPLLVLSGAATGVARAVRAFRAAPPAAEQTKAPSPLTAQKAQEALLLWSFAAPVLLLALPGVPRYDGIRLMLPAYPFLAVLAAEGAAAVWDRLHNRLSRGARTAAAAAAALWLLLPVALFHPYQLCYYGELAGGPWGAHKLGFETTYWGETFDAHALNYLNRNVPENGRVALLAVGDFVWQWYQDGTGDPPDLRKDIRLGDFDAGDWDYLVVVPRQGWLSPAQKQFIKTHTPAWTNGLPPFGSPPVLMIYRNENAKAGK